MRGGGLRGKTTRCWFRQGEGRDTKRKLGKTSPLLSGVAWAAAYFCPTKIEGGRKMAA